MGSSSILATPISLSFSSELLKSPKQDSSSLSLSWSSSFPHLNVSLCSTPTFSSISNLYPKKSFVVEAAWTRRSRSEAAKKPNKKSWKQRTDMYMRPFLLNVFFSKRFIHAKVMHRGTSKVISVATTNAKDLRNTLPSLIDNDACRLIGKLIAERSKEADVYALSFELKKDERVDVRLGIILDTIKENDIIFV
ncbi:ribosomal protein [Lithospermum erythrorhizon]|uniref:Ribosomal protein n=1 Tax=Lithospermum erythrorhizon TaxID=34254 RepID=A0AAV3P2K3_LITER